MSLMRSFRSIRKFVGGNRAFIELTVGPPLSDEIRLTGEVLLIPMASFGNGAAVKYGVEFLKSLRLQIDQAFTYEALRQGVSYNHVNAAVYIGLSDYEFARAGQGELDRVKRIRSMIGVFTGGTASPILRIKWASREVANAEFLGPSYRGICQRTSDDPICPDLLTLCATDRADDEKLHYFSDVLAESHSIGDVCFRIARLYSLLENMAAPVTNQFLKQCPGKPLTRTAIRFMLGYFRELDVPKFSWSGQDFEFDHIELAGQLRDKIFHGSRNFEEKDVSPKLSPGVRLLKSRPDMIAHMLRKDCERELASWANRTSEAWKATIGHPVLLPSKDPTYSGKELGKPLVSAREAENSPIGSIFVRVTGSELAIARLHLHQTDLGVAFSVQVDASRKEP